MTGIAGPDDAGEAFARYAGWYDAFNTAKDYEGEVAYLLHLIGTLRTTPRNWLDLGCGTGRHLAILHDRGIDVTGVDASAGMIEKARERNPGMCFVADMADQVRLEERFDVVSMLYHVMSYVTADEAIVRTMRNAAAHLQADGVFLFDFWHSPGVERDPPGVRVREAPVDGRRLFRVAAPREDRARKIVDIRYEFRWDSVDGPIAHREHHRMRHFAADELSGFLAEAGLQVKRAYGWMTERPLGAEDWYGVVCAQRSPR